MRKTIGIPLLFLLLGAAAFLASTLAVNGQPTFWDDPPKEELAPERLDTAPPPEDTPEETPDPRESYISVPIFTTADEAAGMLEAALVNPLYDVKDEVIDRSFGESRADLLLEKTGRVGVSFAEGAAGFSLPFRFSSIVSWRGEILGISSSARKEIMGAGRLHLDLSPALEEDWRLKLNGAARLEWTSSPTLNILGQEIGIASLLTDLFNRRSGDLLASAEEEINRSARIREHAEKEWEGLFEPIRLSEDPDLWLSVTPISLAMPPFSARDGKLTATAGLKCLLSITAERPGERMPSPLPGLEAMGPNMEPGVLLNVESIISYAALGDYVTSMEMPEIDIPGGSVTVNRVEFFGRGESLVAEADISGRGPGGAVEGKIYIMGRPVYSRDDEVVRMEDADFEEKTNSALAKAAAWLARPALLKEMTERMVWPLGELRERTAESLSDMLKERWIADDVMMEGDLSNLSLEGLSVGADGLRLSLTMGGGVSLRYGEGRAKKGL
ncbi:MAG: DUF4403 family protein [Synergistaceae bacterium]|nr:DUF4403 family protein [Synergistota bacterium]NLM70342.1 DUF4403 family protein [Synergistaceae bacterium]